MGQAPWERYAQPVSPLASPTLPYQAPQAATNLAKSQFELQQARAQASADTRIKNAQAIQEEQKASDAALAGGDALGDPKLTGAARFASVPEDKRPLVQLLLNNQLQQLGSFSLGKPQLQSLLATAKAVNPAFDPSVFNVRNKAMVDFTGEGKGAQAIGTIDRLGANLQTLKSISDQMGGPNVGWGPANAALAAGKESFEPTLRAAYDNLLPEVSNQFDLVMKSNKGTPTVSGTDLILKGMRRQQSQAERDAAFQVAVKAVHGAILPLKAQWDSAYGGGTAPPMWLSPQTEDFFAKMDPANASTYNAYKQHSLPGVYGDQAPPLGGPPPPPGGGASPLGGGPNPPPVPTADYSGMTGAPQQSLAGMDPNSPYGVFAPSTREVIDKPVSSALAALAHKRGASFADAAALLQQNGHGQPAFSPDDWNRYVGFAHSHPNYNSVSVYSPVPTTLGQRMASSPGASFAAGAGTGLTAGLSDVAGRAALGPQWDAGRAALAATHPGADLAGNVAGGVGGMFAGGGIASNLLRAGVKGGIARDALAFALKNPIKAGAVGDAAYGGIYGGSENPDNPLAGAAIGAASGLGGGLAGNALAAGTGVALRGVVNPAAQRLRQAGIPLTVGEALGGGWKKAQDAMTSVFGPGNMVARRYAEGREALNRTAFNQAGQIVGSPIDAVGQQGIQALNAAKSQAYSNALDPVSLDLNTPGTIRGLGGALNTARGIPAVDQASDIATGGLANYIGNAAPEGVMSGTDFQQAYRGLSRLGRQSSGRVYGHEIGQALGQGQDALVGALQEQNPGAYADFLNANSANRHLSVLTDAVNAAKNQIGDNGAPLFTPAQLGTAATSNARIYSGKVAAASGERPFNQLAMDAQQVMSSKLGESGTIPRALVTGALMGGGGMFGGRADGGEGVAEGALGPLAMLTLFGTRRGQQLLTASLFKRTAADQLAGNLMLRNPQIGGYMLTSAGAPLLSSP